VLCVVWNGTRCASDLVILDAASLQELAVVVELPLVIPATGHSAGLRSAAAPARATPLKTCLAVG